MLRAVVVPSAAVAPARRPAANAGGLQMEHFFSRGHGGM
jgi:hypothetical protein